MPKISTEPSREEHAALTRWVGSAGIPGLAQVRQSTP
jgi:hypothetical protein